ncbi:MAG: alpha/beta hydrolase [Pseudomonadota bacterium]
MDQKILTTTVRPTDLPPLKVAATHYVSAKSTGPDDPVFFCLPGGGLSRRYFDLGESDGVNFSFAARMTALGADIICADHIGIGDNATPDDFPQFTPRQAAQYLSGAAAAFREKIGSRPFIGLGHSMGGFMTMIIQGAQKPFDATAFFGAHAQGLDWGLTAEEKTFIGRPDELEAVLLDLTQAKFGAMFVSQPGPSENSSIFGGETHAINELLKNASAPLYTPGGLMSMIAGSIMREVQAINTPIFFAFGDRDLGGPPQGAAAEFINAPDIRIIVLPETGHNSLGFSSIGQLCTTLNDWSRTI